MDYANKGEPNWHLTRILDQNYSSEMGAGFHFTMPIYTSWLYWGLYIRERIDNNWLRPIWGEKEEYKSPSRRQPKMLAYGKRGFGTPCFTLVAHAAVSLPGIKRPTRGQPCAILLLIVNFTLHRNQYYGLRWAVLAGVCTVIGQRFSVSAGIGHVLKTFGLYILLYIANVQAFFRLSDKNQILPSIATAYEHCYNGGC